MVTKLKIFHLVILFLNASLAMAAMASIIDPISWTQLNHLNIREFVNSDFLSYENLYERYLPESAFTHVLMDREYRVSKEFQIPATLEVSTEFWLRIYTQYSTRQTLLFDARHPEIIYEVLDFRDLYKRSKSTISYELNRVRILNKKLQAYRFAFEKLAKQRKSSRFQSSVKKPGLEMSLILAAKKRHPHSHSFQEMKGSFKHQTGQRDNIIKGLLSAETFFRKMEEIFIQSGAPPELTRLSLVESSFNLKAISRAGASGIWQFMRHTGSKYLLIDDKREIDERISPLKSSIAAARLLRDNFRILRNWSLAVTSYNHGFRGLKRFQNKKNVDQTLIHNIFKPCTKKSPLGFASRNYYSEFLAVLYAESYRNLFYGEAPLVASHSLVFQKLVKPIQASSLAVNHGIPVQLFRLLNPDIQDLNKVMPRGFLVAFPLEKSQLSWNVESLNSFDNRKYPFNKDPPYLLHLGTKL